MLHHTSAYPLLFFAISASYLEPLAVSLLLVALSRSCPQATNPMHHPASWGHCGPWSHLGSSINEFIRDAITEVIFLRDRAHPVSWLSLRCIHCLGLIGTLLHHVPHKVFTSAYNRFNRWSRRGVWKRIFDVLAAKSRDSLYLIDSTIVKAHRAASGAKGGRKIRRLASAVVGGPRKSMRSSMARADP